MTASAPLLTYVPPFARGEIADACRRLAPRVPRAVACELEALLDAADAAAVLPARLAWLARLSAWLRGKPVVAGPAGRAAGARLWLLLAALDAAPHRRAALARLGASVVAEASAVPLYARTGLPRTRQLGGEALDRLARALLPRPPEDHDFADLLSRLVPDERAAAWLEAVPAALLARLFEALGGAAPATRAKLAGDLRIAVSVLALRAAALGLDEDLSARSGRDDASGSPFLALGRALGAAEPLACDVPPLLAACRADLRAALDHLETFGVSVDLVFRIEAASAQLDRIERLAALPAASNDPEAAVGFLRELATAQLRDRRFGALVGGHLGLLARKIVESAGRTGEHYIATTRAEMVAMFRSAAGGGVVTAFTAAGKYALLHVALAPFFFGLFTALDYAASFLVMQAAGFTLATKQPSFTAAALAASLDERREHGGLGRLVDSIACAARSQLVVAAGNVGVVVPAVILLHLGLVRWTGSAILDHETAHHVLASLDPLRLSTAAFAAFTGLLLFGSSMAAGWLENWAVFRRLPEAIARHRALVRWLGDRRAAAIGRAFGRAISGVGHNVSLGFTLGMFPSVGAFFGVPLEVRHVTLSAGALTLAACALGPSVLLEPELARAALGIGLIGAFNFGVSFSLALVVALRARDVDRSDVLALARAVVARLFGDPLSFFWPPRDAGENRGEPEIEPEPINRSAWPPPPPSR